MPPVDPSIALQTQVVNPTNLISGFLDLGQKQVNLDRSRQTLAADVARAQAESTTAQAGAKVATANVQPLIAQQAAQTGTAQAAMSTAQLSNLRAHAANTAQGLQPLSQDPNLTRAKVIQAVTQIGLNANSPTAAIAQSLQGLPDEDDPTALKAYVANNLLKAQDLATHLDKAYPSPIMVQTGAATQPVAGGNVALTGVPAGTPQGVPTPNAVGPGAQEDIQTDAQGNRFIVQKSPQGVVVGTRAVPGATAGAPAAPGAPSAGPVNLPPNETPQTRDELQTQRLQSQVQAAQAGTAHQLNRQIIDEVDKNPATGIGGASLQKLGSYFGYKLSGNTATDYNVLGKMLERSALTAAQGMGPHTNAGLEAQIKANGSLDYTPAAIRTIATLNDALITGQTMYQQGLEKAVASGGIFAKRGYDQAWGQAADPDALRVINAVDNKDTKEQAAILAQVGGKGSPGALTLAAKLQKLRALAGQ